MTKQDILLKHLSLHLRFHGMDYQDAFDNLTNDLAKLKARPLKPSQDLISFDTDRAAWLIPVRYMAIWERAYPAVNIGHELEVAAAWLVANPKKAPRSNYSRFLTGWLNRVQDKGGTKGFVQSNRPAGEDKAEAWAKT